MSLVQYIYINKIDIPDISEFLSKSKELGYEFIIDEFYKPFNCSGFLPCTINGIQSGFEIDFSENTKLLIDNYDTIIECNWGSDFNECACVLLFSAILSKYNNAKIHYLNDDIWYTTEETLSELQSINITNNDNCDIKNTPSEIKLKPWWKIWK